MNKYERVRALALRVLELERGAPALVAVPAGARFLEVAKAELLAGVLPYEVVRHAPGGRQDILELQSASEPPFKKSKGSEDASSCLRASSSSGGRRPS